MKPLGQQIRDLRTTRRQPLTQTELAARAGVSWSFIAKVEAGNRLPSMATLDRIAEVLGARVRIVLVKK